MATDMNMSGCEFIHMDINSNIHSNTFSETDTFLHYCSLTFVVHHILVAELFGQDNKHLPGYLTKLIMSNISMRLDVHLLAATLLSPHRLS